LIAIVAALSRNRVIGRDGDLPWHLPGDLKHFKELTSGGTVVMGRKTYESLPERFRPLPNRRNVVLTRNGFDAPGADVRHSLDEALEQDCFVIGGGSLYAQALPLADRLHLTEVEADVPGDTFFPATPDWRVTAESEPIEENGLRYRFRTYDRAH
jgi:dihydrofolate reductase